MKSKMKRKTYLRANIILLIFLIFSGIFTACNQSPATQSDENNEKNALSDKLFDEELAKQLGADEYGMKKFVMAFLKSGPNRSQDSTTRANLQRAHLDNIGKLAEEGKLVLAGPFLDNGELRGIYIFNVSSIEEAESLTKTDPAIQAGSLIMELKPWYGSASIIQMNDLHERIAKVNI